MPYFKRKLPYYDHAAHLHSGSWTAHKGTKKSSYNINDLCDEIENGDFGNPYFHELLQRRATFKARDFISDLRKLGTAFEYYDALQKVRYNHNVDARRNLYHEGKICDSLPFLEKYRQFTDDTEYLEHFNADYNDRMFDLLKFFPDFKMQNRILKLIKQGWMQKYILCSTLRSMPLPVWLRTLLLRQISSWTMCFRKAPF